MNGLGKHDSSLNQGERDILLKAFWASVWVYNLTLTTIKVSILTQYLRIFPIRRFRIACFIVLGIVVTYGAWAIFSSVFICQPVAFAWNKSITGGRCINQLIIWVTNAGVNIGQDVVIFLMPLFVVRTLPIPKSQKKGLVVMFVLGASVTMVSIIRLYSLDAIANSNDVSFDNTDHATLSVVEVNMGIVCACLPSMRPLFGLLMPQYFSEAPQPPNDRTQDIEHLKQGPNVRCTLISRYTMARPNTTATRPSFATRAPSTIITRPNTARTRPTTALTHLTRPVISRTITSQSNASRAASEQDEIPLQPVPPMLSRTASGKFFFSNSHRDAPPPNLRSSTSQGHSRSGSNASTQSTASEARGRTVARLESDFNPLRMSPVTPFNPSLFSPSWPAPLHVRKASPLASGSYTRTPSNTRTPSPLPPRTPKTPGSDKQLPITPFPVGYAV
ncbi:pth11-like integral membrane protein [Stemphylium lycopersici]|uniref:Pth11-like integral membrane protein n=1 Tax=Stemphylium lycopersici TaxID=183478 RepID=A0A364MXS7_STELY|nr:pth11-like integral membrane protein [Stemphylium lycopersici]RAR06762.1 pth11-like integral membrane protein [Stemphylium lycopersici]